MVRRESEVLTVPENKLLLVCIHCITNSTSTEKKNNFPPRGMGVVKRLGEERVGMGKGGTFTYHYTYNNITHISLRDICGVSTSSKLKRKR